MWTMLILQLINITLLLIVNVVLLYFLYQLFKLHRGDVPFVSSSSQILKVITDADLLPATGCIVDLGCGSGKALIAFARSGCTGDLIGYENALFPWLLARFRSRSYPNVTIVRGDFRNAELEKASAVYCFLYSSTLRECAGSIFHRLRPGTLVVSSEFPISGWEPRRVLYAKGITNTYAPIYVYAAPAPAALE